MFIDTAAYSGLCSCGRVHEVSTRAVVIESGALRRFEQILSDYGVSGKRCALYGRNSYRAVGALRPRAEQEIVLDPVGLHADERSTAEVLRRLAADAELLIAVGSGTIHDITRFCAHERGIPFVSVPTGASVDGFCGTVAAMTWHGFKKTIGAAAPELVIADTDILAAAPRELVNSGFGDILAKYTALADWRIAQLVRGDYLCERIFEITRDAVENARKSLPALIAGEGDAFERITAALVMSGIAMQMMGNSRPASGAEHHFSHLIEMGPAVLEVEHPAMHGEKTGVGSIYAAARYHELASHEDIRSFLRDYAEIDSGRVVAFFGERLGEDILRENEEDCLRGVTPERIAALWPEIRRIVAAIPSAGEIERMLVSIEAKHCAEDIGVRREDIGRILRFSPLVRNRLTLMRMCRMIEL